MSTFILKCKVLDFLPDMQINHISFNLEMHIVLVSLGRKEKEKKTQIKSLIDEEGKKTPNEIWDLSFDITYYTVCYAVPVFREEAIRLD